MLLAILNKMDDKPPSKRKKLIESFAAQFSFDWFIPYAAKPISEFRIALNDKILKLEKIIDSVRPRLEHGQTVTISCEKSKIFVVEPGNPACLFEKALDHAEETEFYDYYKSLMDYVGGLQKEVNQLKDRKLKSESKHLIKSQNEILNQICGSINEDKEAIINDFTELDKQKDVFLNSFLRKVNKLHDNCNNLITEKIHQLMFKGYTKGKLFKTEYIRIKMGNKWRVRSVLQEHYSKFVKDLDQEIAAWIINTPLRKFHLICFDEFENYLSARGNQLKFNLGFITENLIQTAFSSLGTFFDNWQQVAIENNRDEIDVKIQKSIQSCLSTEALKKIALNFYRIKVWRLFHAYQKDQDLLTKKLDICLKLIRFKLRTKCNWKN
jgi:hypothetical protein